MNLKDSLRQFHISYLRWRGSQVPPIEVGGRVLILAPHPDDEVIGCGGVIARLVREGRAPYIVVMTGGEVSHETCCDTPKAEIVETRRRLTRKALSILGVPEDHLFELNYPDGHISLNNPETKRLQAIIDTVMPDTILVPHVGEGWPDHLAVRDIGEQLAPKRTEVWEYCVWLWYYNVWRLRWSAARQLVMTSKEYELKCTAVDAYVLPTAPCGTPWSGRLPIPFLKAARWNRELYFRLK